MSFTKKYAWYGFAVVASMVLAMALLVLTPSTVAIAANDVGPPTLAQHGTDDIGIIAIAARSGDVGRPTITIKFAGNETYAALNAADTILPNGVATRGSPDGLLSVTVFDGFVGTTSYADLGTTGRDEGKTIAFATTSERSLFAPLAIATIILILAVIGFGYRARVNTYATATSSVPSKGKMGGYVADAASLARSTLGAVHRALTALTAGRAR